MLVVRIDSALTHHRHRRAKRIEVVLISLADFSPGPANDFVAARLDRERGACDDADHGTEQRLLYSRVRVHTFIHRSPSVSYSASSGTVSRVPFTTMP